VWRIAVDEDEGITNRIVQASINLQRNAHGGIAHYIGCIDNPRLRLTATHKLQCRPHVSAANYLRFHLIEYASLVERLPGILTRGHAGLSQRQALDPISGQIANPLQLRAALGWDDHDEPVGQQVAPLGEESFRGEVVR
jgi:hypothetical protein